MKSSYILILLTIGHLFEHWFHGVIGPVLPFLAKDIGISLTQVGIIFVGISIASAISSAGFAVINDLLGGRKAMLVACMASIGIFHIAISLSSTFWIIVMFFWATGIATHIWHPPAMGIINEKFLDRKGFALGIHGTGSNIGMTIAPIVAGWMLLYFDWRQILQINSIPLILTAILFIFCLPSFPNTQRTNEGEKITLKHIIQAILRNPSLLGVSFLSGVRNLTYRGITLFLPFYLVETYQTDPVTIGLGLGIYSAASVLPETLIGYVSDRISRKLVITISLFVGGVSLLYIPFAGDGMALFITLAAVGSTLSIRSVLFAYAFETADPKYSGSVVGLMFTSNQIVSGIGLLSIGIISDLWGTDKAFWFIAFTCFLFTPLFLIFSRRNFSKSEMIQETT
ncbi:MAG: MFS transporter [Nitrospinota bacterium]|nr:MFS transporter [Nitrospinota bacterium]